MSRFSRRISLRDSFMEVLAKRSLIVRRTNKLKGLYLFRALVRLILEYIEWLIEEPAIEEITDVRVGMKMVEDKKEEKKVLTLADRSILLLNPEDRTPTEKTYILELFKKFRAFGKYPDHVKERLAQVCLYQYLGPGRVIVRQDREAENLYFLINGELKLSRMVTDRWTGESKEIDLGPLNPGDTFGEVALLHKIPRTATVVSKTVVDLFRVPNKDFNEILRPTLLDEWGILQDALIHFNYFKCWDEKTIRECCILSRIKDFQPDEILLGDGKGMVNYVHFILDGECRLIEHMIIREQFVATGIAYELYDPKDFNLTDKTKKLRIVEGAEKKKEQLELEYEATHRDSIDASDSQQSSEDYTDLLSSKVVNRPTDDFKRASIITTTLLDVINEWHNITDVTAMLMREPSQHCYPNDVRTIFMQICTFTRGACFGLGENMLNRRIVSITPVRCFLIPRYWLSEHNRANIWERVKLFMDTKFPTKNQLFKEFLKNRRWLKYKNTLLDEIGKRGRRIRSNVTTHDVPYSIRITKHIPEKKKTGNTRH